MKNLFIASLQLPVNVIFNDDGVNVIRTEGGPLHGLQGFYREYRTTWLGHTGIDNQDCTGREQMQIDRELKKLNCIPVYSEKQDYQHFLHEFSRNTIWPLFHYFPQDVIYNEKAWESYITVNRTYAEKLASLMNEGDVLWIHDYHLLLLPLALHA